MRLVAFSLEGYRRFAAKTSIKLHGDMVALVGPNEAGKSSLLRAIAHLGDDAPFASTERTRRAGLPIKLSWHLQLEDDDKALVSHIREGNLVERVVVTKDDAGRRSWSFQPNRPKRDRSSRQSLAADLQNWRNDPAVLHAGEASIDLENYDEALRILSEVEDLTQAQVQELRDLSQALGGITQPTPVHDEDVAGEQALESKFWEAQGDLTLKLNRVADEESLPSPAEQCADALKERLPQVILFKQSDRELSSEYELTEVADNPPAPLMHLASLAGLDLKALRAETEGGEVADASTRRNQANETLRRKFERWKQHDVAIQLEVVGTALHVQATTPDGLSSINERSDGLKWFAALLAFVDGWPASPILLADEVETHLHYDAQADLIAVLARQSFASKVIYTTHSFGCLPYDLGTGVRVVQPVDASTSRLENGFWKAGSGFSPLLVSMGAAALSFTPTRHAVIAEGPADAILLPTLLREATGLDKLGFQVAPGLAEVSNAAIPGLTAEAGHVAFLSDGDAAGEKLAERLLVAGVRPSQVFRLRQESDLGARGLESEDLVDLSVYIDAANAEIRCWNEGAEPVTHADLQGDFRSQLLESWCKARSYSVPDKTAVAQRVVDTAPQQSVLAAEHRGFLVDLHERVGVALDL